MKDNLSDLIEHHECCNESKLREQKKLIDSLNKIIYDINVMCHISRFDTSITMQAKPENHAIKLLIDYLMKNVKLDNDQK